VGGMYLLEFLASFSGILSSLFIAFAAFFIAIYLRRLEKQQRRRATATLLADYAHRMIFPREALIYLTPEKFAEGAFEGSASEHARNQLISFLNSMEYVSILVRTETIDEDLAKEYLRGTLVAAFKSSLEFILRARVAASNPRLYEAFEAVAHRWERS
jgi:hypothetical protein